MAPLLIEEGHLHTRDITMKDINQDKFNWLIFYLFLFTIIVLNITNTNYTGLLDALLAVIFTKLRYIDKIYNKLKEV